jgi:hypothetical protein
MCCNRGKYRIELRKLQIKSEVAADIYTSCLYQSLIASALVGLVIPIIHVNATSKWRGLYR